MRKVGFAHFSTLTEVIVGKIKVHVNNRGQLTVEGNVQAGARLRRKSAKTAVGSQLDEEYKGKWRQTVTAFVDDARSLQDGASELGTVK